MNFYQSSNLVRKMVLYSSILHAILILSILIYPLFQSKTVKAQVIQTIRVQNVLIEEVKPIEIPTPVVNPVPEKKESKPVKKDIPPKKIDKPKPKPQKTVSEKKKIPEKTVDQKIKERLQSLEKDKSWEKPEKVISQQKTSKPKSIDKPQASVVSALEPFPYSWYLTALQNKVKQSWNQPTDRLVSKPASVQFCVDRNGNMSQLKINQTSGVSIFDESAMKAVQNAAPFAPLPLQYKQNQLTVTIIFELE